MRLLLFAALVAVTSRTLADEEMSFFSYTQANQTETVKIDYAVPYTRFFSTPTWDGNGSIPVSVERAISIARNSTVRFVNGSFVKPQSLQLQAVSLQGRNNRWWYVVQFKAPIDPDLVPEQNTAIVLMDGSTVAPHRRAN